MNDQATLFALDDSTQELRYQLRHAGRRDGPGFAHPEDRRSAVPVGQYEGKRRVAWFGWQYDYSDGKLKRADEIPPWLSRVTARVEAVDSLEPGRIKQVLVTEYEAGAGIGWHRDKCTERNSALKSYFSSNLLGVVFNVFASFTSISSDGFLTPRSIPEM